MHAGWLDTMTAYWNFKKLFQQCMQNLKMDCFPLKGQSGIPIDLTFEQTINADAACQRAGISAMTNSISNRQRWAKSYYIRTTVISHLFESPAIAKKEDVTKELKP